MQYLWRRRYIRLFVKLGVCDATDRSILLFDCDICPIRVEDAQSVLCSSTEALLQSGGNMGWTVAECVIVCWV